MLDNTDLGFCVLEVLHDPDGRVVDYLFVETNPSFEQQTGLSDATGRTARTLVPNLEQAWVDAYADVDRRREPSRFESGSDAMARWFDVYAFPVDAPERHRVALLFNDTSARKAAETELRRSEEQFRVFAQAVPNQVWAATGDGHLDWFNAQVYAYCGAAPGTLDGAKTWGRIVHPDDLPRAAEAWTRSLATGETYEVEFRIRRHDGAFRWFLARALPVRNEAGAVSRWVGTNTDIDDNRRQAAELARLNSALQAKVEERTRERDLIWSASSDLLCVADLDGYFVELNPAWAETLGWSEEEMRSRPFLDFVHPGDRDTTGAAAARLSDGEAQLSFENRYRHSDGSYRWLSWNAVPREGRIYATVRDVTQVKRQAEELDRRTRERDRVWQSTNDLMGTAGFDGYMKSINPAWTRMLGWTEEELLARPFAEIVDPADHSETADVVRRLSQGETVTDFVDHVRGRDGAYRTIDWTAIPEVETSSFHIVGRDVTDQKRVEEQLRQSQKMEAVGQLTGGLAHDFNNLLAGISGSLEMMETRIAQGRSADVERYLSAAQGAARRAAALTHRLLAFSRRQTLEPKATNVNVLVAGMEELVRRTVGPSILVEVVVASGAWPVLADPNQLENALLNLCINARDAMPDGGRLTIETGNRWLDERAARERDLPPGQYVSLCVSDNGTGMPRDVVERAMEPFFTTKPIGVGTGLGLSMIYGFARQSGGQVRIYSEVGQGTMVCVYLPRHLGDAEAEPVGAAQAAVPGGDGETVLVIDDEPLVRMLVVDVLEDLGYRAIEAADGPSGMKVLQSNARIDLLITDVGLPNGMNGRQVADAARELRPTLKVLFVTGYAENAVLNHGHLDHGMSIVTKPFNVEDLGRRIGAVIRDERP
ncbi:PAS domain S-box protein [Jeongeupella avenae]|uniref:PAS domain S-box protein n=1 Tax=Antarcticirhabdus aurantiaca TaxID=2606717 RepID=A0ACD4NX61_9HYPH|nr:PAS domain S-box protein [Antarcticirhabdus aurantiaca]WAJ31472.1 PAS domain S-box protein [Jeongeuplla avenae]